MFETVQIDACGLECPLPLLRTKKALSSLVKGQKLLVFATDSGSWRDLHSLAERSADRLLQASEQNGIYCYLIEKG